MNIIDLQDNLKNLPENALMKEMQQPTGSAPPFLILGELKRRKQMRDDYNRQQNSDMKTVTIMSSCPNIVWWLKQKL